jgi:hypothetical protein
LLELSDTHSGDTIMKVEFTLEELSLLITGLYGVKGVAEVFPSANLAKKRETTYVSCEKVSSLSDKGTQELFVKDAFEEKYAHLGYELQSTGVTSQQRGGL